MQPPNTPGRYKQLFDTAISILELPNVPTMHSHHPIRIPMQSLGRPWHRTAAMLRPRRQEAFQAMRLSLDEIR